MILNYLSFLLILGMTWPIRWLSYPLIHRLGRRLGQLAYYLLPHFRKRALSNLAMATDLHLTPQEIRQLARASIENLMITCLEYPKLASEKKIERIAVCENPQVAEQLIEKGQSVIFFCGHQANWEILFLEGSHRMHGLAIGRPIKNIFLYRWVVKIREKFGGKIIAPHQAVKEGLRALKKGCFLGIVGDQGKPDSGFCSPFLGRLAYTSPLPALLACRTGAPIIVATTRRCGGRYLIHYSEPIWPDSRLPMQQDIERLMKTSLKKLETSIQKNPSEWLWVHNRWKLRPVGVLKSSFRHESLAIFLPPDEASLLPLLSLIPTLQSIYPEESILIFAAKDHEHLVPTGALFYSQLSDLFMTDYRLKLLFNFSGCDALSTHFKKQGAFTAVNLQQLKTLSGGSSLDNLSDTLTRAICHAS